MYLHNRQITHISDTIGRELKLRRDSVYIERVTLGTGSVEGSICTELEASFDHILECLLCTIASTIIRAANQSLVDALFHAPRPIFA